MPLANENVALLSYFETWPGLVGVNVYVSELPKNQADALSTAVHNGTAYSAVVIQSTGVGGIGDASNHQFSTSTKQVKCYAQTPARARAIWNECRAALKALHRNQKYAGVWLWSAIIGAPMELREDAPLNWPLCTSTFDLMASEVT